MWQLRYELVLGMMNKTLSTPATNGISGADELSDGMADKLQYLRPREAKPCNARRCDKYDQ